MYRNWKQATTVNETALYHRKIPMSTADIVTYYSLLYSDVSAEAEANTPNTYWYSSTRRASAGTVHNNRCAGKMICNLAC